MSDLRIEEAGAVDAAAVRDVIHAAFGARQRVEPPSTALEETTESVAEALKRDGGLLCRVDAQPAGAMLFGVATSALVLRRVSVVPHFQSRGVASALVGVAEGVAAARGFDDVRLAARAQLPATVTFWRRRGYAEISRDLTSLQLGKALGVEVSTADAEATRNVGAVVAGLMRAGDVVILTGGLGAGKTTLTQGLGAGLRVRGGVTSPTFVISRVHPSLGGGPALVHVDAYRLGDGAELDDLDLDAFVDDAVTVVEWGEGIAEALADDRLRVHIARSRGDDAEDGRTIKVIPVGARWYGAGVRSRLLGRTSSPP